MPPPDTAAFHRGLAGYRPTPLREVPGLAAEWGVRRVVVKDESARLGLPAFKALGVVHAVHRLLAERPVAPRELVAATEGNHGRALARVARTLGLAARVVVPRSVDPAAAAAIRGEGAEVVVADGDYDAAVARAAGDAAARPGAVLVQDTAWPGYEQVPRWIVEGYTTMFTEVDAQLGADRAALVVTPMGVGSLAQAVLTHYKSRGRPVAVLGVEPDTAAGVLAGLRAGRRRSVPTGTTVMAGLNCGTPSWLAWPALRDGLDVAVAVSDPQATAAAAELHSLGVPAGPCGAACVPAVRTLLADAAGRAALGLTAASVVVLLSTERSRG